MANLPRPNLLQPWAPTGSEWADRAVPRPQSNSAGRVYDPEIIQMLRDEFRNSNPIMNEQGGYSEAPQAGAGGMFMGRGLGRPPTFADTGFAGYLRDYYLPRQ